MMDSLIGSTLGQYQILEDIGRGGMAVVYKGWQPSLQRSVAIKVLFPNLTTDEFKQRFQQEAIVAANLSHSNIVTIYEVAQQDGLLYIVMEYIKGRTLAQIIAEEAPLPLNRTLFILAQVAEALDYAHQQRFVHRDIKPANILITDSDRAVITDFGIAKALEGSGATAHMTTAGTIMGTPAYMSPEQIQGESVDFRTDLYSLGIVCYEMLGGRPPFGGSTTAAILYAQVNKAPSSIRLANPSVPKPAERALARMLSKRPEERFPSARSFVTAMMGLETTSQADLRTRPVDYSKPFLQRLPPLLRSPVVLGLLGGILLLTLVLVCLLVAVMRPLAPTATPTRAAETTADGQAAGGEPTTAAVLGTEVMATSFPTMEPTAIATTALPTPTSEPVTPTPLPQPRIYFTSKRDGNPEIYVMDVDGQRQRNLSNSPSEDYWPQISPDHTLIAFHSYDPGQGPPEIYVMNLDGNNWVRTTRDPGNDKFPSWSPDGSGLVFASDRDGDYDLYVMAQDGTDVTALTSNSTKDYFPAWSPTGDKILFDCEVGGYAEICAVDAPGGEPVNLTRHKAVDTLASWSPDGQQIAFSSDRSGEMQVWVMNANGSSPTMLTREGGQEPHWSPDGTQIVFVSLRDGNMEIYVMNADGSGQIRLTTSPAEDWNPCWVE